MNTRHLVAVLLVGSISTNGWAAEIPERPARPSIPPSPNTAVVGFVSKTLAENPQVKAAQFAVKASQALQSAAAKPLYNPELDFEVENAEVETRTIGVSQTLDWSGKRSARRKVATAEQLSVLAEFWRTRQNVSISLLSGLAAYQTSVERNALATERVQLMNQFHELAKKRFSAGDIPLVESNLAKLVYAQARMQRATTATDTAEAAQQLSVLTSIESRNAWPTLDSKLPLIEEFKDPELFLESLPAVRAANYRMESAKATASLRRREKRVDPTIGVMGGEEGDQSLVGFTFSIPIPIRNSFNHEAVAANEQYLQEEQLLIDVRRRAKARFTSAYERYQIAREAWIEWQQIGQSSIQQQDDQLHRLWQSGDLSTTEFLVQSGQTIDSQDSALELRHSLWRAWFEWLGASGQIDGWLNLGSESDANQDKFED